MPAPEPNEDLGQPEKKPTRRGTRDRHGRHEPSATRQPGEGPRRRRDDPRWTLGPPKTVPMTPEQYQRAVRAWAALLAAYRARQRPDND